MYINYMIVKILDFIHLIIIFNPILLIILPKSLIKKNIKWFLILNIIIPLHWYIFDNRCVLTELGKYFGGYKHSKNNAGFTETNLKWLYKPIMKVFGWNWNSLGIDKMSTLHWLINIFIIWYMALYVYKK